MTASPMALPDPDSILIVKPSSLGDIVHTLPAAATLREAFPNAQLRWVANTEWLPLLKESPLLDECLEFPRRSFRGLAAIPRMLRWGRDWRSRGKKVGVEWVLDFQGLLRSALIGKCRSSGPLIGLSDAREGADRFYQHTVPVDATAHAVDRYLELPRAIGIPVQEPQALEFPLPNGSQPKGWPADGPFIVIHPWSRGAGKSLTDEQLGYLCSQLAPHRVVIVGKKDSQAVPTGTHLSDLSNQTTLPELIWVMREAVWCISVDSGPMHIAAAVNPKTLGIHTWSDPRKVGPYNPRCFVWKGGRICHWADLSNSECLGKQSITHPELDRIARFTLDRLGEKH